MRKAPEAPKTGIRMRKAPDVPKEGFAKEGSLADAMHRASSWATMCTDTAYDALIEIFDGDQDEPDSWPCEDIRSDPFSNSIELRGCRDDLELTEKRAKAILALGFKKFSLRWEDGSEQYCHEAILGDKGPSISERKNR